MECKYGMYLKMQRECTPTLYIFGNVPIDEKDEDKVVEYIKECKRRLGGRKFNIYIYLKGCRIQMIRIGFVMKMVNEIKRDFMDTIETCIIYDLPYWLQSIYQIISNILDKTVRSRVFLTST